MTLMRAGWTTQRWTAVFTEQSAMFREAVGAADPTARLGHLPGWTFTELTLHVARFLEVATRYLRTGSPAQLPPPPVPSGMASLEYLDQQLAAAAEVLPAVPGDRPTWTFSPSAPDLAWVWHRRVAHEVNLRRWDAQAALRTLVDTDPDLAADGIDEHLGTLLAARYLGDTPPNTVGTAVVRLDDLPESWFVRFRSGEVPEVRSAAPGEAADVSLSGRSTGVHYGLKSRVELKFEGDEKVVWGLKID